VEQLGVKRPFRQLKIIGKRHRVVWDAPLVELDGELDLTSNVISIAPNLPHDEERDTVLHEVTHAVEKQLNAHIPEDKLRSIVTGIYAVLKDNPKLAAYLLEEEADDDRTDSELG
jgi:hypothetical protein